LRTTLSQPSSVSSDFCSAAPFEAVSNRDMGGRRNRGGILKRFLLIRGSCAQIKVVPIKPVGQKHAGCVVLGGRTLSHGAGHLRGWGHFSECVLVCNSC
jgi:hypothetical protein